jgi:hypothetical protein
MLERPDRDELYKELTPDNGLIAAHTFDGDKCIDQVCNWLLWNPFESDAK